MTKLREKLKEEELKATPQRLSIYEFLLQSKDHPNVEEIYEAVQEEHPSLSLATVYKTVDTFHLVGLVKKLNTQQDSARYDGNTEPHIHLVCDECGRVWDADYIEASSLAEAIENRYGFTIKDEQHMFNGVCEHCKKK